MTKSKEMRSDFNLDREDICNESGLPDATVISEEVLFLFDNVKLIVSSND